MKFMGGTLQIRFAKSANRGEHLQYDCILKVGAVYDGMFAEEDGSVPATYQVRGCASVQ